MFLILLTYTIFFVFKWIFRDLSFQILKIKLISKVEFITTQKIASKLQPNLHGYLLYQLSLNTKKSPTLRSFGLIIII
ncbi:hypothetical protein MASR1M45_11040 [Candidatus Kapaibacterium sp.]